MLKVENVKLSPGDGMGGLTREVARILKVREKDLTDLRVVRRSVDAREDVRLVYAVEVSVRDEAAW